MPISVEHLRILTLNIWNRQGPWEARRELIRAGLAAEAPQVAGLQEVLRYTPPGIAETLMSQARELADGLFPHVAYGPAWTSEQAGPLDFGNAILSHFPILLERNFVLPNPAGHETRALLYALLDTPAGRLPVFCTHLDWQFELSWVRCQQVLAVTQHIAAECAAAAAGADVLPPVLLGDFNAEPESDEIRYLRGLHCLGDPPRSVYFADCHALAGPSASARADPGPTFARSNRYAAMEQEPDRRIDYIFVGRIDRHLRGEPIAARRCFTEPQGGVFPSDHYGVVADLHVAPRRK